MPEAGLEPARHKAEDFKSSASTISPLGLYVGHYPTRLQQSQAFFQIFEAFLHHHFDLLSRLDMSYFIHLFYCCQHLFSIIFQKLTSVIVCNTLTKSFEQPIECRNDPNRD